MREFRPPPIAYATPSRPSRRSSGRSPFAVASIVVSLLGMLWQIVMLMAMGGLIWARDFNVLEYVVVPALTPVSIAAVLGIESLRRGTQESSATKCFAFAVFGLSIAWFFMLFGRFFWK